jgi:hypothetical protein
MRLSATRPRRIESNRGQIGVRTNLLHNSASAGGGGGKLKAEMALQENGKLGGGFQFTCQVKVSDFGGVASIALFSAFASSCLRCSTAAARQIGPPCPASRASGKGNWDRPKYTTCGGRAIREYPTYSAFWSVFGATCLRIQRLASSVCFGATARLGPRKNLSVFFASNCG